MKTKKWWKYALMLILPMMASCSDNNPDEPTDDPTENPVVTPDYSVERDYMQGDNLIVTLKHFRDHIYMDYIAGISNLTDTTAVFTLSTQTCGMTDMPGIQQYASFSSMPLLPGCNETSKSFNIKIFNESDTLKFRTLITSEVMSCGIVGTIAYDETLKKQVMTLDMTADLQPAYVGHTISDSGSLRAYEPDRNLSSTLEMDQLYANLLYIPLFEENGTANKKVGIFKVYQNNDMDVTFDSVGIWVFSQYVGQNENRHLGGRYGVVTFPSLDMKSAKVYIPATWFCNAVNPLIGFYKFSEDAVFNEYATALREALFPILANGVTVSIDYTPGFSYGHNQVASSRAYNPSCGIFAIADRDFLSAANKATIDFITSDESRMQEAVEYLSEQCSDPVSQTDIRKAVLNLKEKIHNGEFVYNPLTYRFGE